MWRPSKSFRRVLYDTVVLVGLAVVIGACFIAQEQGHVYRRGFFCDDESIRLPYKDDTVPDWALVVATAFIPLLAVSRGGEGGRFMSHTYIPTLIQLPPSPHTHTTDPIGEYL